MSSDGMFRFWKLRHVLLWRAWVVLVWKWEIDVLLWEWMFWYKFLIIRCWLSLGLIHSVRGCSASESKMFLFVTIKSSNCHCFTCFSFFSDKNKLSESLKFMFALLRVIFNESIIFDFNVFVVLKVSYIAGCFTLAHILK